MKNRRPGMGDWWEDIKAGFAFAPSPLPPEGQAPRLTQDQRKWWSSQLDAIPNRFTTYNVDWKEEKTVVLDQNVGQQEEYSQVKTLYRGWDQFGDNFGTMDIETWIYPRMQTVVYVYGGKAYNDLDSARNAALADLSCLCDSELYSSDPEVKANQERTRARKRETAPDPTLKGHEEPTMPFYGSGAAGYGAGLETHHGGNGTIVNMPQPVAVGDGGFAPFWYVSGVLGANAALELLNRRNFLWGTGIGILWGFATLRLRRRALEGSLGRVTGPVVAGSYHSVNASMGLLAGLGTALR